MAPENIPTQLPEQQVQQPSFNEGMKDLALKYPEGLIPTIDDLDSFKDYASQISYNEQANTYEGPEGESLNPALARRTMLNAEYDWRMSPELRTKTTEVINALNNPQFTSTQGKLAVLAHAGIPARNVHSEQEAEAEIAYWKDQAERIIALNVALDARKATNAVSIESEALPSEEKESIGIFEIPDDTEPLTEQDSTKTPVEVVTSEANNTRLSAYMRIKNRIHDKIFNDPLPARRDYYSELDDQKVFDALTPEEQAYWNEPVQKRGDVLKIDEETLKKMNPKDAEYWTEWLDSAPNSVVIPPKLRIDFEKAKKETKFTKITNKAGVAKSYISENWHEWIDSKSEASVIVDEFYESDGSKADRGARARLRKLGKVMVEGLVAAGSTNVAHAERLAQEDEELVSSKV